MRVVAEWDGGSDCAVLLASVLELSGSEVVVSGLEVVVDLDVVEFHTLIIDIDFEPLGGDESVTNFLELPDVVEFEFVYLALIHVDVDLGDELAELFNASLNLVLGAILKVLRDSVHVGDEGVGIVLAFLKAFGILSVKSAFDNTAN